MHCSDAAWPVLSLDELSGRRALLRRPLGLAARRDHARGAVELDLIYRVVGAGTRWLRCVRPGDEVSLLGPLGNGFAVHPSKPLAALVGGGVGIPPLLYLAEALARAGKKVVAFAGACAASALPLRLLPEGRPCRAGRPTRSVSEFAALSIEAAIATDDGSLGFEGQVTEPFRRWLAEQEAPAKSVVTYSCGPEPMMRTVAETCIERGVHCQLSLERHMACGMGTCQSCVCKLRAANERGWSFKLCCQDGPVFDAREVVWESPA